MIKISVSNARLWPGYVETLPKRRCRGALNFLTKKSIPGFYQFLKNALMLRLL